MTYQEIKDRLTKCEYTLIKLKDSKSKEKDIKTIAKLEILKESLQKKLNEAEDGVIFTDDERKAKELAKDGARVKLTKEEEEVEKFTKEEISLIAKEAGKAVVEAILQSGDEVSKAKVKDVYASALSGDSSPGSFTVHVIYKNDSEVSYRFQIVNNVLYYLADNKDIKLSDVGIKPSGEPLLNKELIKNEMSKYFQTISEMTDQEFADAKEADRLAKHPQKDKIIAIQNLIAKEKSLKTEGPYQTTYVKISKADYKKAMGILDSNIDPTYAKMDVVDDDGAGNVIIYFNFRAKDDGEPGEDPAQFIYDVSMDLEANGISIVDKSHDLDEANLNDPVLMKLRALKSKIVKKKEKQKAISSKRSDILSKLQTKRSLVMRDMEQEAEPEGGPIADKYGDMLNKIDAAIAKAKGTKEKSYDDTFKEGFNDGDDVFAFGYDLNMIQAVVDHLKSNYSEDDYELHIGRGDTHPNAVTLKNPDMDNDKELGNLLIAAEDQEETDYQSNRELEKDYQQENALGFSDIEKFGSKAASDIDISVRRDPNYTFGKRPGDDARLRYMYAKKLGYIREGEYAADKYNVNVFGYQTRYFKICPGAKSFMERVIAQQNDKENKDEIIRIAKLHDLLFMHEIQALKDPAYAAKVLERAEYIVKTIKDDVDTLGLDVAEVDYLDNHIEKIKDAASKGLKEDDIAEEYTKEKLLAYLGQADDAMIRTYDDKYLIIYNPKNGNDDNAAMWHDDTVFGVDQDGEEHEVRYDQIDGLQLEQMKENSELDKITKAKRLIKQQAPAMNKLPQDDPKRKAFIDKVKQINKKYKELLDKEDNKVSGIGKDQELDEGRGDMDMIKDIIKDRANESGFTEREEAAEVIGGIADEYMISLESLKDYIDEGESDLYEVKVGDTLTKDGKKGKVTKISDTQATVDFGNGDVYGIAHSRIKGQEILKEGTDLYNRNGIQITRFSGGKKGLMLQINIGGKYIVVPADEFNNFIRALASIKDDVRDMKLQQPRDRYEEK